MAFLKGRYEMDIDKLPAHADEIHAKWFLQELNGKVDGLLLSMHSDEAFEGTTFVRFFCGIQLGWGNGKFHGQGTGQVVLTDRRILGMLEDGVAAGSKLDSSRGIVYAFSFDHADAGGPRPKLNWRSKPTHATFHSNAGQDTPFALQTFSVAATVKNDGSVRVSSLSAFLDWFGTDGRPKFT